MECLKEIIGVLNGSCPCNTGGTINEEDAAKLAVSKSGLYMDDLEGGLSMRAITSLDACKGFADIALQARDSAIQTVGADVLSALALRYKTGKNPFVGVIGRPSYTGTLQASKRYQFVRLAPLRPSDAIVKVTGLRLIINSSQAVNFKILKTLQGGNQGTEILNVDVETTANYYASIPLPGNELALPLTENGESLEYYMVWDRGDGLGMPKDIKIDCNCGFKKAGFTDYLDVKGGELDSLEYLSPAQTKDNYTHGIVIDADIRCAVGDLICREYDRENAIALTLAYATRYKAGEILIEKVMSSPVVDRYTMMNREYLWGKRNHFRKEYETRITYVASVMDVAGSDCFICRETKMFKATIN